jgi:VWFA-related protein
MRKTPRFVAVATFLGILAAVVGAQTQPPPGSQAPPPQGQGSGGTAAQGGQPQGQGTAAAGQQQQPPTFRTGINFVRVDAIVSDRDGKPVADLKQADFEVLEDGKPQTIETFRFVSVSGNAQPGEIPKAIRSDYDEESEAARDDVRLFTLFLDDYHVRRGSALSVRKALVDFMQKDVGPSDMVGLMYPLQPVSSLRMTRDHDSIIAAINKFEGRKYDYRPRNEIEEQYAMYPAAVVERIRNQVTLSALEALSMHLGSLREGRKAIILVSEGYSNVLPPQLQDPIASMPGLGNPARGNPSAGGIDDRTSFFANVDLQSDLREVYNAANRNNTTIYSLDPRGLTPFEFDINEGVNQHTDRNSLESSLDTLRVLADQTDGRAIVNRNDLEMGLKQVVRDSSAYYLLGYNSSKSGSDGKFHEIKVRIRRPGTQVRARKGYWALTAEEAKASLAPPKPATPPAVTKALSAIEQTHRARFIRSWIGTSRGDNGKTRVTFVWEQLPPVPGQDRNQAAAVSLIATGAGDRPYFRGRVPSAANASAPPSASAGQPSEPAARPAAPAANTGGAAAAARESGRISFDADPGSLQLRIAVQGGAGTNDTLDTDVREFKVPDLTAPQAAISTPAVFRTATAREFRDLSALPDPVPTAARDFRRTERLLIRFDAYGPGNSVPEVTARVLNRGGKAMADLPVRAPQGDAKYYQLDLPLAGFASGEYLVEIRAKGPDGEAQELVPIKITS